MATENNKENNQEIDEADIHELINNRVKAVRAKDIDAAMSHIAPDILSFDVVNPLQYTGLEASRNRASQWFSSFEGPIGYEVGNVSITTGSDVAFSHCLNHVSAKTSDGGNLDMWWRATACYRKIDGKWFVTHEHNSVPFDPESGKASLGLKP